MKKLLLPVAALLLLVCACQKPEGAVLTIFHTNDIQGFYWPRPHGENAKETGGMAILKEMLDAQPAGFLLFDSGDTFSKTQEGQIGMLGGAVELMNKTKYDAATLSAADFALGWDNIQPALAKAQFPVVISNLQNTYGNSLPAHIKEYVFIERGGLKIAVLGVISAEAFPKIQRNSSLKVLNEIETLKNLIPRVQEEGADLIILLSSAGFELENTLGPDEKTFAEELPEINLILGGNGDISPAGWEQISNTYISRAKPALLEAEKITLAFNAKKQLTAYQNEAVILDKETFGADEELSLAVADSRAAVKKITGRRVATLPFEMEAVPDAPSRLGAYTADCIRRWASNNIGIINSDLFLQGFAQGALTEVDLLNAIPFNDRVMLVKMRGDELQNALEHSIEFKNNWPQTAGIEVVYDMAQPFGKRIQKIIINGAPLRNAAIYSVSTSDHIVAGGFGHNEFINVFEFKNTDRTVRDIVKWCLYRQKEIAEIPSGWSAK